MTKPERKITKRAQGSARGAAGTARSNTTEPSIAEQVKFVLSWLKRHATKRTRDGMARYGIPSENALGVTVADIRVLAKRLGRNHARARALWKTGVYEARMLTAFIAEPARVTPVQMDRWCRDFDSWAICDTLCFHLFDRTPHGFGKVAQWNDRRGEFEKRAAFALLASLAGTRKDRWRRTISQEPAPDRTRCARRTELREEGGELGAPRSWPA